jgi:hypothetical protein
MRYNLRKDREIRICSDSLTALKALRAITTMSPLVHQCQRALNDIPARHAVGFFWVPGHAGIRGNEIADGLARGGSALSFFGPEPALGVSRRDQQMRLGHWSVNQHGALWRGLGDTQRQAREFISGPSLGTRAKFMALSRIQSRVVTSLLTGHNTLRSHLYLLGLSNSPLCVGGVRPERKPRLMFCVNARLWPHADIHTWAPSFWSQGILRILTLGPSGTAARLQGYHDSI